MMMLRRAGLALAALIAATPAGAQGAGPSASPPQAAQSPAPLPVAPPVAQSPTPVGVWLHDNKRIKIDIAPCGDRLCATIVWFKWPNNAQGLPLLDVKNTNPALRARPLLGLQVLYGLRRTGENEWEDGKVYNPYDGVDYDATMSMGKDGTLRIRAYVFLPLFGHTLVWTRVS